MRAKYLLHPKRWPAATPMSTITALELLRMESAMVIEAKQLSWLKQAHLFHIFSDKRNANFYRNVSTALKVFKISAPN